MFKVKPIIYHLKKCIIYHAKAQEIKISSGNERSSQINMKHKYIYIFVCVCDYFTLFLFSSSCLILIFLLSHVNWGMSQVVILYTIRFSSGFHCNQRLFFLFCWYFCNIVLIIQQYYYFGITCRIVTPALPLIELSPHEIPPVE